MTKTLSYSQYFELADGLLALDSKLDASGVPIPFRKYIGRDWLIPSNETRQDVASGRIQDAANKIQALGASPEEALSVWYNDLYGHVVYEPPASSFIAALLPHAVVLTYDSYSKQLVQPDVTIVLPVSQPLLETFRDPNHELLRGLGGLQNLPSAKWIWLSMSDYDVSVAVLRLPRPAYHLALWHTLQCLEKCLKAVLLAHGSTEDQLRKFNHNIAKILTALNTKQLVLSASGQKIALEIEAAVGGPSTRYVDDTVAMGAERIKLRDAAINAHHLLLRFFALESKAITHYLLTGPATDPGVLHLHHEFPDGDFRALVYREHATRCNSH